MLLSNKLYASIMRLKPNLLRPVHFMRNHFIRITLATAGGILLLSSGAATIVYATTPIKLSYHFKHISVLSPIRVSFNEPVNSHLHYTMDQRIAGSWHEKNALSGISEIEFIPSKPLTPGSTYYLIIGHVAKIGSEVPEITQEKLAITTESPPEVASIAPADMSLNNSVSPTITVRLKSSNKGLRQLVLTSDAAANLASVASADDQTFLWKFTSNLAQSSTYHLYLDDLNQPESTRHLATTIFSTVSVPKVISATQTDHLYPNTPIMINFDQPMQPTDADFKFNLPGSGKWTSPVIYQFNPATLVPGTNYSYTILRGSKSVAGGITETDQTFNLSTPGALQVISWSPSGGSVVIDTSISLNFDQPVDPTSAQAAFSINPSVEGSFSWSGNSMIFHPPKLDYQTTYNVILRTGIKSLYGLPSAQQFSHSFTTIYQTIRLGVPYYHQTYTLSCEESSLRMALAYYGLAVSDLDVVNQVGYNPRPRDISTNSWDNPNTMFVGDINGIQGSTGWGVYSGPIASAAQHFGRTAQAIVGISATQIATAVHNNNPIVLWGFAGTHVTPDSWNTTAGVVQAPLNEHVRTVIGVDGSAANPIGFYVNDPVHGLIYWTTAQLINNMTFGGTLPSQGVIVQ